MCYARFYHGGIAQLVEHTAHIRSVCGSIPHAAKYAHILMYNKQYTK